MAKKQTPNIGNLIPSIEDIAGQIEKPRQNFGRVLLLVDWKKRKGQRGEFYILRCIDPVDGHECQFSTGSWMIDLQLEALGGFPIDPIPFRFVEKGDSYAMQQPDANDMPDFLDYPDEPS